MATESPDMLDDGEYPSVRTNESTVGERVMYKSLFRFMEAGGNEIEEPIEKLRFFCSIAMTGDDWLDVEQFFDDVIDEQGEYVTYEDYAEMEQIAKGLRDERKTYSKLVKKQQEEIDELKETLQSAMNVINNIYSEVESGIMYTGNTVCAKHKEKD